MCSRRVFVCFIFYSVYHRDSWGSHVSFANRIIERDSLKDETIVLLFIVMTTGLLGWAILKPWVEKLRDNDTVQRYAPIGNLDPRSLRRGAGGGLPAYRSGAEGRHRQNDSTGSESFARQGGLNS